MAPEVNADDAGPGGEAVRRIREESELRLAQRRRRQAFASWCALATLAGGISLTALNAHEARLQREAEAALDARREQACARRATTMAQIDRLARVVLAEAPGEEEREEIRAEVARERAVANEVAAREGCRWNLPGAPEQ